jgi:pimeloyl-ACP methyl ester carboxylesterase
MNDVDTTSASSLEITLVDGRRLTYAEHGDPGGTPVFYFHGFPGCRLDWPLIDPDDRAAGMGIRVIAADRPGMGGSSPRRNRRLTDWPADVTELADALAIGRFAVLGVSGGGPYAAACAHSIAERVTAAALVCGMGPADAPGTTRGASWLLPAKNRLVRLLLLKLTRLGLDREPGQFLEKSLEVFAEPDRAFLQDPRRAEAFLAGQAEALRQGVAGADREAILYTHPWGFELGAIEARVSLWHGTEDANVPIDVARYLAAEIPDCAATYLDGEGHLSILPLILDDVFSFLAEPAGR